MNRRHFLATLAVVLPFGGALVKWVERARQQEVIERCLRATEEALSMIHARPAAFDLPPEKVGKIPYPGNAFADAEIGELVHIRGGASSNGTYRITSVRDGRDGRHVEMEGTGSARGWRVRA